MPETYKLHNCLSLSVVISTKKEEFANNLSRCVATQTLDTCLAKILEDLRSLMPTGIPELGLRPTEPLKIENIQFKTRPGIGVQIDSEFSNVRQFYLVLLLVAILHAWLRTVLKKQTDVLPQFYFHLQINFEGTPLFFKFDLLDIF